MLFPNDAIYDFSTSKIFWSLMAHNQRDIIVSMPPEFIDDYVEDLRRQTEVIADSKWSGVVNSKWANVANKFSLSTLLGEGKALYSSYSKSGYHSYYFQKYMKSSSPQGSLNPLLMANYVSGVMGYKGAVFPGTPLYEKLMNPKITN
ncbi:hypothetical protein EDD21DRAFT_409390 [Dissophora ornata]|nr:hypothetical protein BGZ58_011046 [Dissophora ornata]KAI8595039.1 hypothetical protein EDD21DRAFT_409390 [Dissophora ornata]